MEKLCMGGGIHLVILSLQGKPVGIDRPDVVDPRNLKHAALPTAELHEMELMGKVRRREVPMLHRSPTRVAHWRCGW